MAAPSGYREVLSEIYRMAAEDRAIQMEEGALTKCGSPIEVVLTSHLPLLAGGYRDDVAFAWNCDDIEKCKKFIDVNKINGLLPNDNWIVFQQISVGQYKLDFLLYNATTYYCGEDRSLKVLKECLFAVECDGHDFHERTKEQAARDKRRDREILACGVPTLRFTGSEIYRDPIGVINEIHRYATGLICREAYDAIDLEFWGVSE